MCRGGAIEFGIVPSDLQFHAIKKSGAFEFVDATYGNIRSVLSLHGEPLTLIARRDSGIRGLQNLAGSRINIGSPVIGRARFDDDAHDGSGMDPRDL